MPTQAEFDALKALVDQIAASPKVKPYIDGGTWPRKIMIGEGTVSSGEQDRLTFDAFLAKAKPKLVSQIAEAEKAVATAKAEFDVAQRALIEASGEMGGRYLNKGRDGSVVEDAAPDALIQTRTDVPEYRVFGDAERKLIGLKVKLFSLQKARDAERLAYELKRNPIKNPSKDEGASWASRVRLSQFGGKR